VYPEGLYLELHNLGALLKAL
jgi:hypothetical protein